MTKKDSGVGRQKYSNVVCENIVIVVLTMCDLTLSVFCLKPNKSLKTVCREI